MTKIQKDVLGVVLIVVGIVATAAFLVGCAMFDSWLTYKIAGWMGW